MTDSWFISDISRHVWEVKYRRQEGGRVLDATPEDTWRRVARALARVEGEQAGEWESRFYRALEDFRFIPGGRILAGAGTRHKVTLFNCFVMGVVEDSMEGIFEGLKEGAVTLQRGGGVGYDFSALRPKGAQAQSAGNAASGPVSFMHIWDRMCATILSAGARRGAMMATLRCDHPDIEEFIAAKSVPDMLRHFNLSVLVSDEFMEAVKQGRDWPLVFPLRGEREAGVEQVERLWSGSDRVQPCRVHRKVPARALWEKIMRATYGYAEPGVIFIDRVNRMNNLAYCERISATNPCVTADTWVHTAEGPRQVGDLLGRPFIALVNGKPYPSSPQGFFRTGSKMVYHLRTREGYGLRLTADHPVLRVSKLTRWKREASWTRVGELRPGDQLVIHNHSGANQWPGFYGEQEGYLIGLLVGDGTFSAGQAELRAWPRAAVGSGSDAGVQAIMSKAKAIAFGLPHRSDFSGWRVATGGYRYLKLAEITRLAEDLGVRPGNKTITTAIEKCSSDFYRGFLQGLFDADGSVQGLQSKGVSIRLASSQEKLLEAAQRMLLRLGIASVVYRNRRPAGARMLPDGRGGKRAYECRVDHELAIAGDNIRIFSEVAGFADAAKVNRLKALLSGYKRNLNRERFTVTVEALEPAMVEDVFDAQIPGINAFDANGFFVHNCGEIPLPPYGACDLGSVNLARFVQRPFEADAAVDWEGLRSTAAIATRMLDNVYEASQFPLERQREAAQGSRRIGLGVTGLADALIMLGIRYGSDESFRLAAKAMAEICHSAYRASARLALEKGPFPRFKAEAYLAAPFIRELPPDIRESIQAHGIRNSHLIAIAPAGTISLLANNASSGLEPVYQLSYLRRVREPDGSTRTFRVADYAYSLFRQLRGDAAPLPPAFVTAERITPAMHLQMQAALQRHVDSAISKTVNVPEDFSFGDFLSIYEQAYSLGLKGCTTFRPNPVTGRVLVSQAEAGRGDAAVDFDSQCQPALGTCP